MRSFKHALAGIAILLIFFGAACMALLIVGSFYYHKPLPRAWLAIIFLSGWSWVAIELIKYLIKEDRQLKESKHGRAR